MQAALKEWRQGYAWLRGFEDACNAEYQALHATVPVGVGARMLGGAAMIASWLTAFIYTAAVGQVALALVISLPLLFAATCAAAIRPRQAFTALGEAYADQVVALVISLPLLFAATFAAAISPRQAFTAQGEAYADQVGGLMRYMEGISANSATAACSTPCCGAGTWSMRQPLASATSSWSRWSAPTRS